MILDGWGLGRASLQAGLLPTRAGAPAALPGNWAEEFHAASSLRQADIARTARGDSESAATTADPRTAAGPADSSGAGCTRRQLAALLVSAAQPAIDVVVLAQDVDDLPSGTYAAAPDGDLRSLPAVDADRFCRTVLIADRVPPAALVVVARVPPATNAVGLRAYRHALIAAGRFGLAAGSAAIASGLRVSTYTDFVDTAANRQLGLLGTDRACALVVALSSG